MFRVKFLILFFTALIWQVSSAQSYYDAFRTNIESPRQFSHHQNTINNWADQLRDPEFKDAVHYDINTHQTYQNEHDESDIEESNYMQMNATTQDSSEESNYASHSNINQLSEMIKLNESESRMHTYHLSSGRGEIMVHRPAPIILKRPSTRILINHPPLVVKPAPIVFHRPPPIIMRPIIVSSLPRRVQVQPMYVKVVKPKKKVMIKENTPCECEEDNNIQEKEYYNEKQRTLNDYQ